MWRPMSTAPKDGSRFLASAPREVVILHWGFVEQGVADEKCWVSDSEGPGYNSSYEEAELGGWQPLPDLPKSG
jgi:hypothetical protein